MSTRQIKFINVTAWGDVLLALDGGGNIWQKPLNKQGDWEKIESPVVDVPENHNHLMSGIYPHKKSKKD